MTIFANQAADEILDAMTSIHTDNAERYAGELGGFEDEGEDEGDEAASDDCMLAVGRRVEYRTGGFFYYGKVTSLDGNVAMLIDFGTHEATITVPAHEFADSCAVVR